MARALVTKRSPLGGLFFGSGGSTGRSLRAIVVFVMTGVVVFPMLSAKWLNAAQEPPRASAKRFSMISPSLSPSAPARSIKKSH
jgi:hypothetical protein